MAKNGIVLFVFLLFSIKSLAVLRNQQEDGENNVNREQLRQLVLGKVGGPVKASDFAKEQNDPELVALGRLLFHDKILSGNKNISCSTCHDLTLGTSDGLSMSVGEGGIGLGPLRSAGMGPTRAFERVPRNSPALFNLGAIEFVKLFHDGRVAVDENSPSGFSSPAGRRLPRNLDSLLAVQAMFPVTSPTEMAGQADENSVGAAAAAGNLVKVWQLLVLRVQSIPEYVTLFKKTFADVDQAEDITFSHIANAIAAYEDQSFRTDQSPFDRFLAGDLQAVSESALRGMRTFYKEDSCSRCHSGKFQTDMEFHAIVIPQIGPGTGDGMGGFEDFGRERVTRNRDDRYKFRTPSLRNVELTGPWGHTGAYPSLRDMVIHYKGPRLSFKMYDRSKAILPEMDVSDFDCLENNECIENAVSADEIFTLSLGGSFRDVMDFLKTLTDPRSVDMSSLKPTEVPSQLLVD